MTTEEVALAAAHRIARRLRELHPGRPYWASGYARDGVEIPAPFCGGPREGWDPPPGAAYVRADVEGEVERVWTLHQPP